MNRDANHAAVTSVIESMRQLAMANALWRHGDHVLVAVSGGPDSVCLLDALCSTFAPADQLRLSVAHIHHGLRAEAGEDAQFVERLAQQYGLPCVIRQVDVPKRVAETGESVEAAARELRYAALREIVESIGADAIVTGHTADDQAETVLMRVLRGTGVTGLAGIPARRDIIIRPLLGVWRHEIEAYVRERHLAFCTDRTNLSTEYTRNRIRLDLLPLLEAQYAPRVRERLNQLSTLAREDARVLDDLATTAFEKRRASLPDGIAILPDSSAPRAIEWRVWRLAIAAVTGMLDEISFAHIQDIARLHPGEETHLPGVRVYHEVGRLAFIAAPRGEVPVHAIAPEALPIPGKRCFPDAGCCLTTELVSPGCPLGGGDVAVLDVLAVQGPLYVRSWQAGDRFRPFGAPGSRKVQDIFVDAKVPRRLRERIPVVLDSEGIIWLAGFRPADRVKINAKTTHCLRITIQWELNPWTLQRFDNA